MLLRLRRNTGIELRNAVGSPSEGREPEKKVDMDTVSAFLSREPHEESRTQREGKLLTSENEVQQFPELGEGESSEDDNGEYVEEEE